jgi:hypothetical protein
MSLQSCRHPAAATTASGAQKHAAVSSQYKYKPSRQIRAWATEHHVVHNMLLLAVMLRTAWHCQWMIQVTQSWVVLLSGTEHLPTPTSTGSTQAHRLDTAPCANWHITCVNSAHQAHSRTVPAPLVSDHRTTVTKQSCRTACIRSVTRMLAALLRGEMT